MKGLICRSGGGLGFHGMHQARDHSVSCCGLPHQHIEGLLANICLLFVLLLAIDVLKRSLKGITLQV